MRDYQQRATARRKAEIRSAESGRPTATLDSVQRLRLRHPSYRRWRRFLVSTRRVTPSRPSPVRASN
ncbi:hypothetical protein MTO96_022884 [Rhipicephalus appendiculatus]